MKVRCPQCRTKYALDEEFRGEILCCTECGNEFVADATTEVRVASSTPPPIPGVQVPISVPVEEKKTDTAPMARVEYTETPTITLTKFNIPSAAKPVIAQEPVIESTFQVPEPVPAKTWEAAAEEVQLESYVEEVPPTPAPVNTSYDNAPAAAGIPPEMLTMLQQQLGLLQEQCTQMQQDRSAMAAELQSMRSSFPVELEQVKQEYAAEVAAAKAEVAAAQAAAAEAIKNAAQTQSAAPTAVGGREIPLRERYMYMILACFFGVTGIHDIYAGRLSMAFIKLAAGVIAALSFLISWMLGLGLLLAVEIWALVDLSTVHQDGWKRDML